MLRSWFVLPLMVLALAACGGDGTGGSDGDLPEVSTPVDYDGRDPAVAESDADGGVVVENPQRGVRVELTIEDEAGSPVPGAEVAYDELGDTALIQVFDPASGRKALRFVDLSRAQAPVGQLESESITAVVIAAVALKAVIGVTLWRHAHAISEEIALEIEEVPRASVTDGVTEMCLTPEEFVFLTQAFAAMREREIGAYRAFGEGVLTAVVPSPLPDSVDGALDVVGLVSDLGHVGDVLGAPAVEDIREFALDGLDRSDLGENETLEITFLGFRSYPAFGDGYTWSAALITGANCDPASFTESVGEVEFTSDLSDLDPRAGAAEVTVKVSPAERGLPVYLVQTGGPAFYAGEFRRRIPPEKTDSQGYATFWLPVNTNDVRTLTATVPERRVAAQAEISWKTDWSLIDSTLGPELFDVDVGGYQTLVGEQLLLRYRPGVRDELDLCEVDWREGSGWEEFTCPNFTKVWSLLHQYETTGIFRPTIRLTGRSGLSTETFGIVSVVEDTPNVAPTIESASISGGVLTYVFTDENDFDRHECSLWDPDVPFSDPFNGYLLWKEFVCPRSGSAEVTVSAASDEVVFRVSDGASRDQMTLAGDSEAPEPVVPEPILASLAAIPAQPTVNETVSLTWDVTSTDVTSTLEDDFTCIVDPDPGTADDEVSISPCMGAQQVQISYGFAGPYTVTVTVTGAQGGSATTSALIDVLPSEPEAASGPVAQLVIDPPQAILDGPVLLDASNSSHADGGLITRYYFDAGDGRTQERTSSSWPTTYSSPGDYKACVEVEDSQGERDEACQIVTVVEPTSGDLPNLVIDYFWIDGVRFDDVNFTSFNMGAEEELTLEFEWSNAGPAAMPDDSRFKLGVYFNENREKADSVWGRIGDFSTTFDPYEIEPGTYTVSLRVDYNNDIAEHTETDNAVSFGLNVRPPPNQPPTAHFNYAVSDLTVDFTDLSSDPNGDSDIVSWTWVFGDGRTSSTRNPNYSYANGGSYQVSLTVRDGAGEVDSVTKSVTVAEPIAVQVSPPSATLAPQGSTTFSAAVSGTEDVAVTWSATCGSIDGSGATVTYHAPGTEQTCSITATSTADSRRSDTAHITISSAPVSHTLLVDVVGSGKVISTPSGIDCGTSCSADFEEGTSVTLTAVPDDGWAFGAWDGASDCMDGGVALDGPLTCTVTFIEDPDPPATPLASIGTGEGAFHSLAIDVDGSVWLWGARFTRSDGGVIYSQMELSPVSVGFPTGLVLESVSAGNYHSMALDAEGRGWAWGLNSNGQLGIGTLEDAQGPVQVIMPTGISFAEPVPTGYEHSLALDTSGDVWRWGNGLRDGPLTPTRFDTEQTSGTAQLAGGSDHFLALDLSGKLWAWGANSSGQLGNGAPSSPIWSGLVEVNAPSGVTFTSVAAGSVHSLALDQAGKAWAWGYNGSGRVGDGTEEDSASPTPVLMPSGLAFVDIAGGWGHSVALDEHGQAWAWGNNEYGQLGTGNMLGSAVPVRVSMPQGRRFTAIAAGRRHTLALDHFGYAWAWGENASGQLGDGTRTDSPKPVLVSEP